MGTKFRPGTILDPRTLSPLSIPPTWEPLGPMQPPAEKKWPHDCDRCTYLGSLAAGSGHVDFYRCAQQMLGPSYVARHGPVGHEYMSFPGRVLESVDVNDDALIKTLRLLYKLDTIQFRNPRLGFGVLLENHGAVRVVVLINPLRGDRHIRYVQDAVKHIGDKYNYSAARPEVLANLVTEISQLVQHQIEISR